MAVKELVKGKQSRETVDKFLRYDDILDSKSVILYQPTGDLSSFRLLVIDANAKLLNSFGSDNLLVFDSRKCLTVYTPES